MKILIHSHFQSLALFLSSLTLALTATVPTNPVLSTDLAPLNNSLFSEAHSIRCELTVPYSPFFLQQHTCERAIMSFNDSQVIGIFHHGDPDDDFSLPVSRTVGNCKVTIAMSNRGLFETASWLRVVVRASQLNNHCGKYGRTRYCGGSMTMGDGDNIKVIITRLMPFAAGPLNGTDLVSSA